MTMVPLLTFVFTPPGIRARARRAHGGRDGDRDDPVHVDLVGARASPARRGAVARRRRDGARASSSARSSGRRSSAACRRRCWRRSSASSSRWRRRRCCSTASRSRRASCPGRGGLFAVGGGIGLVSSMVGAGGAFLSVPFMTACNVDIRNCVATSAALGLPIAVAGTIGFIIAGLRPDRACRRIRSATSTCRRCSRSSPAASSARRSARAPRIAGRYTGCGMRSRCCSTCSPCTCCGNRGVRGST